MISKLIGMGDVVGAVGGALDALITSDDERLERDNERRKAEQAYRIDQQTLIQQQNQGQVEVNKIEASGSWFQRGWRPFVGWICASAIGYQFLVYPLLCWWWATMQAAGKIDPATAAPPPVEVELLLTLLTGMLGIAGARSFDKVKRVDSK